MAMFSAVDGGQGGLLSAFFSNGGDMDMLNSSFLKGMEEANKFLPTNNTLLEAIPDKECSFTVKKEVANGTPTSGNGRGRKYRYDEDDLEAETARSGGCHCSQGGAVDGSCSGPASAAKAAWCGGCHGSHGGAVAAMGGAAGCGP